MPSYTLEIEAFSTYTTNMPSLEIWEDGVLDSTHLISSTGTSIIVTINYPGALPTSLALTFNDAFAPNGRTIEIRSVKINDQYVNTGNYLSTDSLTKGASANVAINADSDFLFDASDPPLSEFTTGATRTLTAGNDTLRTFLSVTPEIFDALAGSDRIYLGAGADKVFGNTGADIIYAGAGNDLISGGDDNDRIFGQDGDDRLYGGNGNDRIHGGAGDDEIHGGAGDDRLNGHDGDDIITGGSGADKLNGGSGSDYLFGGDDNDQLTGGAGDDTLDGGNGNDIVYGGAGVDNINGGDGDDILVGYTGNDIIHGDDGNDTIYGQQDNDTLYGGNGNDLILGGDGTDTILGDAGDDVVIGNTGQSVTIDNTTVLSYGGASQDRNPQTITYFPGGFMMDGNPWKKVQVDYTVTANTIIEFDFKSSFEGEVHSIGFDNDNNIDASVSFKVYGTQGWGINNFDNYDGSGEWNHYRIDVGAFYTGTFSHLFFSNDDDAAPHGNGSWANVIIYESAAADVDTLNGGAGDDALYGQDGNDIISGDDGADILNGGEGNDTLNGDDGDDILHGGNGIDALNGGADDDELYGGNGNDTLTGNEGSDELYGGANNDTLYALDTITTNDADRAETNTLYGGAGDDTLYGSTGTDTLNGGADNDTLRSYSTAGISGTVNLVISASSDDAEEFTATGNMESLTSTDLEMVNENSGDQIVGLRWQNLNIAQGATITNAYIEFQADEADSSAITLTFHAEDIDSAATFTTANSDISSRTTTTASVDWTGVPSWSTGTFYQTPDLSSIIQEVVDRGGWTSGTSDLAIIVSGTAGSARVAESFDGNGAPPRLIVEYTESISSSTVLNGDTGDDTLYGGQGTDTLNGGDGDDELRSGSIGVTGSTESTISSSADDAEERLSNGNMNLTSTDIEMIRDGGNDQVVGLRWQNLNLEQGVRITNAYIEFQADESDTASSTLTFHAEDVDSAAAFTTTNSDISSRTTTTASVDWPSVPSWTAGNFYQTPDLSSLIQEVVDRGGWTSGTSDLAIIVSGIAASARVAESFDGNGTPARLVIEYTDPNSDITILNGQDGQDDLYGSAGIDHFVFEGASAFNDIDTITGFDVNDYDAIDISDVLIGYTAGVDDITDWVRITDDGTDSTLAIDANGTTGGSSYSNVATIFGVTGLTDEAALEASGNIIA